MKTTQPRGKWQEARAALLLEMCEGIHRFIREGGTLLNAVNEARQKYNGKPLGSGRVLAASRASIHRNWYAWRKYRSKQAFSLRYQCGPRPTLNERLEAQRSLVLEWLDERLPKKALIPILDAAVACDVDTKRIFRWIDRDGLEAVNAGDAIEPEWFVHRVSLINLWKNKIVLGRSAVHKRTKTSKRKLSHSMEPSHG